MRAAPDEACKALRVIARKSRRNDIAITLVAVQSSRIKVNSALTSCRTGLLLAEVAPEMQAPASALFVGFEGAFAGFQFLERFAGDFRKIELELVQRLDDRR